MIINNADFLRTNFVIAIEFLSFINYYSCKIECIHYCSQKVFETSEKWSMPSFGKFCVEYCFVFERMKKDFEGGNTVSKEHWNSYSFGTIKSHHECKEKKQHLRQSNAPKSFAYLKKRGTGKIDDISWCLSNKKIENCQKMKKKNDFL